MTDVITDPKMKSFVESSVSNDFGLSVDEVAEQCKSYGRFSAWLNSNVTLIKEVLNAVKDVGVSPVFFAAYERTEGYNASWGWLNHTTQQGSYLNDARVTAEWIVSQSKNTSDNPAWIDFANYKDFVPNDVKQAGNAHFSTLASGTIGKVVIAGTAAATWEVYYPNGLLAEYNGVQNYGTPINHMIQYIEEWGGSISGGGSGGNTIPEGYQLAKFPMDNIDVSQGEWGDYTHTEPRGEQLAMDFMARDSDNNWLHEYPYYAPFDSEVIDIYNEWAQVIWRSTTKVFGVDGTKHDVVTYSTVHDWNYAQWSIGDKVKQGDLIGHTGDNGGGGGGGDHLHLQAFNTNYHPYPATTEQQIHLYDLMDTSNVKIWFRDGGYPWKVWEGGNTPDPDPDPDPDPPDPEPEPPKIDWDKLFSNIDDKLEDMLKTDVYKNGQSDYYSNSFLQLSKQMDNTYKIKPNIKIFETIHDTIDDFIKDIKNLL